MSLFKICILIINLLLFTFNANADKLSMNGEQIYIKNCQVCHADDGSGAMPGVTDLTDNREWLTMPESKLLSRMNQGIQKDGAAVTMPPKGGNPDLTDADIKAVITYMRNTFSK